MLLVTGFATVSQISIVKYRVSSKSCVTVELIHVTSQILMIRGNSNNVIDHPLPKDFVSADGVSHHAWTSGPPIWSIFVKLKKFLSSFLVKFQASILDESHHLLVKLSCKSACENLDV